jgi:hypothetical protein
MTLKDYGQNDMYTFSGNWYATTRLMAIRPSRVKLYNTLYPNNELSYQIKLLAQVIPVYKANILGSSLNWLGNPSIKGSQDPDTVPNPNDWTLHNTYQVSTIYQGINIGRKVIYQDPNQALGFKIAYIVSAPPYYIFEQTSTDSCPVIPYDAATQYVDNQTFISMPYISTSDVKLAAREPRLSITTQLDCSPFIKAYKYANEISSYPITHCQESNHKASISP